jgi:predicted transglutaminase-like cysteine proteinase
LNINKRYPVYTALLFFVLLPGLSEAGLFGYQENERKNLKMFPQWLSVLERNIKQRAPEGDCESRHMDQCHVKNWLIFLQGIRHLPKIQQVNKVNLYANQHDYILDIENYGVEDYWATPREFLYNNGDCEDFAITKMLSLKMLGFNMNNIRLVVLQDTNLRIPHAVLAIDTANDTLIMDNQVDDVISHKYILHYVPVYAVNEKKWWMFLPQ